jgi:prepilin peptidase CpaA
MPVFPYIECALLAMLLTASVYDVAVRRIPNRLVLVGLLSAFVLHLTTGSRIDLLTVYLSGFLVGLLLFLPLYICRAMAAGDVKLMATVGAFTGPAMACQISMMTYCVGGVLALVMALSMGRGREALSNVTAVLRPVLMRLQGIPSVKEPMPMASIGGMPYALAITLGTILVLWLRHR